MKIFKLIAYFLIVVITLVATQSALESALKRYQNNTIHQNQEAVQTLKKEAENGDNSAAFLLATAYKNGKMGKIDLDIALYWYHKAASRGDPDAMLMLGWLYYKGTPKLHVNTQQSRYWFEKAASKGVEEAAEMLELLQ